MLRFIHERALPCAHTRRQRLVEKLAGAGIEHLVPESPASEHGVEIFAARTFAQKACARVNAQLVNLERLYERKFFRGKLAQGRPPAQWALIARRELTVRPSVSQNHSKPYASSKKSSGTTLMKSRTLCPNMNFRGLCHF